MTYKSAQIAHAIMALLETVDITPEITTKHDIPFIFETEKGLRRLHGSALRDFDDVLNQLPEIPEVLQIKHALDNMTAID